MKPGKRSRASAPAGSRAAGRFRELKQDQLPSQGGEIIFPVCEFLRPNHDAIRVSLPLDKNKILQPRAGLDVMDLIELDLAGDADHVGLLERLDDRIGVERVGAPDGVRIDVDGVVGADAGIDGRGAETS